MAVCVFCISYSVQLQAIAAITHPNLRKCLVLDGQTMTVPSWYVADKGSMALAIFRVNPLYSVTPQNLVAVDDILQHFV